MKLTQLRVQNFRCVDDSETFSIGPVTCLVGKNESGKTSLLHALEKLNPIDDSRKEIDKYRDYPRFKLTEYDPAQFLLNTTWQLDDDDVAAVEELLGEGCLASESVTVSLKHDGTKSWGIQLDQGKVIKHLLSEAGCDAGEVQALSKCKDSDELRATAAALAPEPSARINTLIEKLATFRDSRPVLGALDLFATRMPKFLYFSIYDRMLGAVALSDLAKRKANNSLTANDRVFLSFLEFAGTSVEDVVALQQYEPLKAKAEAAGIGITRRIFKYWSQNKHLKVVFEVSPALKQDPPPFNEGMIVRTRILNALHDMTVEFDNRSAGFVWFFSFLVLFSQVAKKHGNVIILLDEPGLNLHGKAQADLLRFIQDELEPKHQVIYTTHSPFMVPPRRLECVRTVEDVVLEKDDGEVQVLGTKVGDRVLSVDRDTVFPIQAALGYDISQSLFVGTDTLLVEGPSDLLYLQAFSSELSRRKRTGLNAKWTICPSGGIDKVGAFLSLFGGNKLHVAVLTDFASGQKNKVEQLKESKLLEAGHVFAVNEFSGTAEADVEDLLGDSLYLELINQSLGLAGRKQFTASSLTAAREKSPRVVKRVQAAARTRTDIPEFDHYSPAWWLIKNPQFLEPDTPERSPALERFERLFVKLNALL
jgi:energy-coupling factor transporter ATP-binding protein EcfA2